MKTYILHWTFWIICNICRDNITDYTCVMENILLRRVLPMDHRNYRERSNSNHFLHMVPKMPGNLACQVLFGYSVLPFDRHVFYYFQSVISSLANYLVNIFSDMKGYAPYFPSSEKAGSQNNGQNFQYARDIQEDGASTGDEHNTSFQGEPIPGKSSPFSKLAKPMLWLLLPNPVWPV